MESKKQILGICIILSVLIFGYIIMAENTTNNTKVTNQKIGANKYMEPHDWSQFSNYTEDMNVSVKDSKDIKIIVKDKKANSQMIKIDKSIIKKAELMPAKKIILDDKNKEVKAVTGKIKTKSKENNNMALDGGSPQVYMYEVDFYWYWIKDNTYTVKIGICNYGDTTADYGIVAFWFDDDGRGYGAFYENLLPYTCQLVDVPFNMDQYMTAGLKPSYVGVTYQWTWSDIWYLGDHYGDYPYAAVYNDNSLGDPNITLTDSRTTDNNAYSLSHFPIPSSGGFQHTLTSDQLRSLYEAAVAGDNTLTPGATSNALNTYVYNNMTHDPNLEDANIRSDIWIRNNGFKGVCKEYASLLNDYSRALRIPSRILVGLDDSNLNNQAHAWCENWNGNEWMQYDPLNNLVNNPCYYKNTEGWNFRIWWMNKWDDSETDENGHDNGDGPSITDGILAMLYCGTIDNPDPFCQRIVYSDSNFTYDLGYWAKYNSNC